MKLLTAIIVSGLSLGYLLYFGLVFAYVMNDPMPETELVLLMCSFAVIPCLYAIWQSLKAFWPDEPQHADTFS